VLKVCLGIMYYSVYQNFENLWTVKLNAEEKSLTKHMKYQTNNFLKNHLFFVTFYKQFTKHCRIEDNL